MRPSSPGRYQRLPLPEQGAPLEAQLDAFVSVVRVSGAEPVLGTRWDRGWRAGLGGGAEGAGSLAFLGASPVLSAGSCESGCLGWRLGVSVSLGGMCVRVSVCLCACVCTCVWVCVCTRSSDRAQQDPWRTGPGRLGCRCRVALESPPAL